MVWVFHCFNNYFISNRLKITTISTFLQDPTFNKMKWVLYTNFTVRECINFNRKIRGEYVFPRLIKRSPIIISLWIFNEHTQYYIIVIDILVNDNILYSLVYISYPHLTEYFIFLDSELFAHCIGFTRPGPAGQPVSV